MPGAPRSALVALLLVCAGVCGSGAADCHDDGATPAGATLLGCTPGAVQATAGGSLLNNQWNAASAGAGPWRQCLLSRARPDGATEYGWSWNWPRRDGLYAYPEVLIGGSPWSDSPSNDRRFPRTVADTRQLQVSYQVESRSCAGKSNLALEFWFTDPRAPLLPNGLSPVKAELMIWSDESDGLIPAGDTPAGTVAIGGMTWTVYLHRDWGDASGTHGHHWSYIAYHADRRSRSRSADYDARKFFDDAIARGVVDRGDRVAGVELGNELVSGSGVSWIRHFTVGVR